MLSIALDRSDVIVGVDTHKDRHVAVALDGLGAESGSASPSGPTKYVIASVALMMTWTPFDESCRENTAVGVATARLDLRRRC